MLPTDGRVVNTYNNGRIERGSSLRGLLELPAEHERVIRMAAVKRSVSPQTKLLFPIVVPLVGGLIAPKGPPQLGTICELSTDDMMGADASLLPEDRRRQ